MTTRRRRQQRLRLLRSPVVPGAVTISPRALMSGIPLLLVLCALVGSWYVQKERQDVMKFQIADLQDEVSALKIEHAAEAGNGLVLEKLRDDVSTIKTDLARIRAKLE